MQGGAEMEIAVMTGLFTKWYMDIDTCHRLILIE